MGVTFVLFGPLRDVVGEKHVEVGVEAPTTIGTALASLVEENPSLEGHVFDEGGSLRAINVTLNGKHIQHIDGMDSSVEGGDVVRLAPPVRGGGPRDGLQRVAGAELAGRETQG